MQLSTKRNVPIFRINNIFSSSVHEIYHFSQQREATAVGSRFCIVLCYAARGRCGRRGANLKPARRERREISIPDESSLFRGRLLSRVQIRPAENKTFDEHNIIEESTAGGAEAYITAESWSFHLTTIKSAPCVDRLYK